MDTDGVHTALPTISDIERMITASEPLIELNGLSREDWLEWRRKGLGGSDASAVCNMNSYVSQFRLWHDKTGTPMADDAGEAAYWGKVLEDAVCEETALRTGLVLYKPRHLYRSVELPFMQGNPDRFAWNPHTRSLGIMEAKTSGPYMAEEWEDDPSTHSLLQALHYGMVIGVQWAQISVLISGQKFKTFSITLDPELGQMVREREAAFWKSVEQRVEPAPSNIDADLLREIWPAAEAGKEMLLPENARSLRLERNALVAQRDEIDERCEEIENQFRRWLEDAEIGLDLDGTTLATHKNTAPRRIDTKALGEELPYVAAAFTKANPTRRLVFPQPKKSKKDKEI